MIATRSGTARAASVSSDPIFMLRSHSLSCRLGEPNAEILSAELFIALHIARITREQDRALVHDQNPIGDAERKSQILLDQQYRDIFGMQPPDDVADLLHEPRAQTFRGFIHEN